MRGDHKVPSWLEEETGKGGVLIDTSPSTSFLFLSSLKHRESTWLPGFETDLTHGGRGHVRLCSPSPGKCSRKTEAECKPVCVCREVRKGKGIKTHTHICGRCNQKKSRISQEWRFLEGEKPGESGFLFLVLKQVGWWVLCTYSSIEMMYDGSKGDWIAWLS